MQEEGAALPKVPPTEGTPSHAYPYPSLPFSSLPFSSLPFPKRDKGIRVSARGGQGEQRGKQAKNKVSKNN